jgi:hypothetical protein
MRLLKQLFGYLAEIVDETDDGVFLQRIFDTAKEKEMFQRSKIASNLRVLPVDIDISFIEKRMEDIDSINCWRSLLFVAENQIDPFVEVLRHVVAFQSGPVDANEFAGVIFGPGRQQDVIQSDAALLHAQIEFVVIGQHVRQVEKFRNQLLHVGHVVFGS